MTPDIAGQRERLLTEREELSRTVQALAERFDVGARARTAAGNARESSVRAWDQAVRSDLFVPVAAAAGALVALVGAAAWLRRHRPFVGPA